MNFIFNVPDDLKHAGGIYKISNDVDNRLYVGRTKDFRKRFLAHRKSFEYLNGKIKRFVDRNPNVCFMFEILEVTNRLAKQEEYWIRTLETVEKGFNKFHNDREFINFSDGCVHIGRDKLKKLALKRKENKKKIDCKKKKRAVKRKKVSLQFLKGIYCLGFILIDGERYDYLGNKIKSLGSRNG